MSCCCKTTTSKHSRQKCPECGTACLSVTMATIFHQVQFPENQSIPESDYTFCPNYECSIGYFSSSNIIQKKKLRAFKGGQEAMLCNCFDVSKRAYQKALASGASDPIKSFVIQQTKAGSCACEARNPSGRCCLADFSRLEKSKAP
ncbi:MAG: hypothetical protein R8K50_08625 [Mariprofundus sp.]